MITREEYMKDSSRLHRAYFAQFVNEAVKEKLLFNIAKAELLASKDKNLNDIALARWDGLAGFAFDKRTGAIIMRPYNIEPIDIKLLKETGEGVSCSTLVCIYKEAARQVVEE